MIYSTANYPYDCVCYIVATYPDGTAVQGSGVIIGAHTVLTASHVLWNADKGEGAVDVAVYPGYGYGGAAISGASVAHYYQVDDAGDKMTEATSQYDFGVIDYSTDLSPYGSFGIEPDYSGGQVHLTGYPASAFGAQTDQIGAVSSNLYYSALDYLSVTPSPGNSGGPLWVDLGTVGDPQPYVVGIVSTDKFAVQLTRSDWNTISNWETADSYLWSTTGAQLHAGQALTSIQGGSGADTILGWTGPDTLFGGGGADSIVGGGAFNQINGNQGDDTIVGHSTTGDWLVGGQGQDSIDASASAGNNILNGNLGNDTLIGGSGGDTLRGGQGDDALHAGSGSDWISGDLGNNTIYGGQGMDTFHAGAGHDVVYGWQTGDIIQIAQGVTSTVTQVNADTHITFSNGGEMEVIGVQQSAVIGWILAA